MNRGPAAMQFIVARRAQPLIIPLLAMVAACVALWPSPHSLFKFWTGIPDYGHGLLIVPLSVIWIAILLWRGRVPAGAPSWRAGLALTGVLLAWVIALRSGFDIIHQLLWPLLVLLSIWAMAGSTAARRLAAPVGLLYFAIPVWDYTLPVLQRLSVISTEHLLALLGVPAEVTEYRIRIPAGTFQIIEGCSGKRYFVVTLAMAYIASAVNGVRGWRLPAFFAAAGALALITNWLRIVSVIYAGHVSDMQHYIVAIEHRTHGNIMFVVLMVAVLWLGRILASAPDARHQPAEEKSETPARPLAGARALPLGALLVAMLLGMMRPEAAARVTLGPLPLATGTWQGPLPPQAGWHPAFAGADDERRVTYVTDSGAIEVYLNLYSSQEDRELVHYGNKIVAPALWTEPWSGSAGTLAAGDEAIALKQMRSPDGRHWLVGYAYLVGGRDFHREAAAKLAYGLSSLGGHTRSGTIATASLCEDANCDQARVRLAGFWEDMAPRLRAMLASGRGENQ